MMTPEDRERLRASTLSITEHQTLVKTASEHRDRADQAETRLRLALEILDGRFQPNDRIGDLHVALTSILKGEL